MSGRLSSLNFSFVIPDTLAGCARPWITNAHDSDLTLLREQGVTGLVSLTEVCPDADAVADTGLEHLHIPIRDFGEPSISSIGEFVDFVRRLSGAGGSVTVHCGSGYGRTGTMIACYLVSEGQAAMDAIREVRRLRPGSIETAGQERVIRDWQSRVDSGPGRNG